MMTLIPRTLILHAFPLRSSIILFHSAAGAVAGEESHRRRLDSHSYASSSSSYRRNYDEENRSVKVTVWWDFENCQVPAGVNVERVANRITAALRSTGIKGPVTITAFGDVAQMSRAKQEALTSTGICLNHVPHRGKNSADRSFMADLVYWVTQNPPPAHFFLISGDKDFANILHRLRMSNYNILLASNDIARGVLCSAATIMWPWIELVKGENAHAKHFNDPPDGFYGSWYGQYKGALEDPFVDSEQCVISQVDESMESISETKIRPIPRVVVNGIRNVLHSYPEGMSISELRKELRRKNIAFDKDLYGHKKFSNLLASMPNIVKFIPDPSGAVQPLVADKRLLESADVNSAPSSDPSELRLKSVKDTQTSKVNNSRTLARGEKPLTTAPPNTMDVSAPMATGPTPVSVGTSAVLPTSSVPIQDVAAKKVETDESTITDQGYNAEVKEGFFKRIWKTLTGSRSVDSSPSHENHIISEQASTSNEKTIKDDEPKKAEFGGKAELVKEKSSHALSSSNTSDAKDSVPVERTSEQSEKHSDTSNPRTGLFGQLANWWQSRKSDARYQKDSFESFGKNLEANGNVDVKDDIPVSLHPETHAIFSRSDFWDTLESFLLTSEGADLISKSSTRDQLVHKLQKEGPCFLKDLQECHMYKLVELLISEKKWVEASSDGFPFKLVLPLRGRCSDVHGSKSNGLSTLFSGRRPKQDDSYTGQEETYPQNFAELKAWFQKSFNGTEDIKPEDFHKLFESKFNKKLVCYAYGYPTIRSLLFACSADNGSTSQGKKKKLPSKEEVLSDCHKLITELLKQNPDGFNMGNFRPLFFQKYGYILDCQMVGYPKLISLLQDIPGVRTEDSFVLPASIATKKTLTYGLDSESTSNGEDWEELGPVSDDKKQSGYTKVSLSDEEFTDSDDEVPSQFDGLTKQPKREEEDSSLMQILDSWYDTKEGDVKKDEDRPADGLVDCSKSNPQKTSDLSLEGCPNVRLRPPKRYSFVVDSGDDEKDRLVDNVLGSLKKAGDSRLQS